MAREPDLDKLSLKELLALREELAEQISVRQQEEKAELKAKMKQLAQEAGFDLNDVVGGSGRGGSGRRKGSAKSASGVTYRNPDNPSETWTGRGRRPLWLVEKLKKRGAKLEDYAA